MLLRSSRVPDLTVFETKMSFCILVELLDFPSKHICDNDLDHEVPPIRCKEDRMIFLISRDYYPDFFVKAFHEQCLCENLVFISFDLRLHPHVFWNLLCKFFKGHEYSLVFHKQVGFA